MIRLWHTRINQTTIDDYQVLDAADFILYKDWELLYRICDIIWTLVCENKKVMKRRIKYLQNYRQRYPTNCSERDAKRFKLGHKKICESIVDTWCTLFDKWYSNSESFIFDDGFSVLFFNRILWGNDTVLLRGHYDSNWKLSSTMTRAKQKGTDYLEKMWLNANRFIEKIENSNLINNLYPSTKIPDRHKLCIMQHYGFPTNLLDFTYSYDVALFFAEGGSDFIPVSENKCETGAIYIFTTNEIPPHAVLSTLPQSIMRPNLQKGAFISDISDNEISHLESFKFIFRHHELPIWNGIGDIPFGAATGLSRYLFPTSDPIEIMATDLRSIL